jgi:alcohol dehydrogenase class IV
VERFFGIERVEGPSTPTILVPTTAGTGSEATSIVVLRDDATASKRGLVSESLFAKAAILDPELTRSLPPYYTAITGLDAFAHAMESYVNKSATPVTEALCLQAMRLVAANLRRAVSDGEDLEARAAMLYASAMAGMGFANTQTGVIHSLGHAVPLEHHLPHGLLIAAASPMGMAYNPAYAPEKYAVVAEILGADPGDGDVGRLAAASVGAMQELLRDLGIKPGFAAHGVSRDSIPSIVAKAFSDERLSLKNPRPLVAADLAEVLSAHF